MLRIAWAAVAAPKPAVDGVRRAGFSVVPLYWLFASVMAVGLLNVAELLIELICTLLGTLKTSRRSSSLTLSLIEILRTIFMSNSLVGQLCRMLRPDSIPILP